MEWCPQRGRCWEKILEGPFIFCMSWEQTLTALVLHYLFSNVGAADSPGDKDVVCFPSDLRVGLLTALDDRDGTGVLTDHYRDLVPHAEGSSLVMQLTA